MEDYDCWTEGAYAAEALGKARRELECVRAEINSGTWLPSSVRFAELRREESELESYIASLSSR